MISNEQRAHDIAILSIHSLMRNPPKSERFDIYALYLNAYEIAIEAVNRDFPA